MHSHLTQKQRNQVNLLPLLRLGYAIKNMIILGSRGHW